MTDTKSPFYAPDAVLGMPPASVLNPDPAFYYTLVAEADHVFRRHSVGRVARLADGRLMFVCDMYEKHEGEADDWDESRVVARISTDEARSWSKPRCLARKNPGDLTVQAPALMRLQSGDLLLTCLRVHKGCAWESPREEKTTDWSTSMAVFRSRDNGKTFVEEGTVWDRVPELWMQGGGVWNEQLRSGRIVVPFMLVKDPVDLMRIEASCFLSDDDGRTWRRSRGSNVKLPERGALEPCITELPDGELVMTLRAHWKLGKIYMSRSSDGGDTWSDPVSTGLDNPESPICVRTFPGTSDLLMVTNICQPPRRTPLNAVVSTDRGQTWRVVGDILTGEDDEFETGVADVMFLNEDEVLIMTGWCTPLWNRERCPSIAVVVKTEWFRRSAAGSGSR